MGKIPILTNIFQMGWNHQPVHVVGVNIFFSSKNIYMKHCCVFYLGEYIIAMSHASSPQVRAVVYLNSSKNMQSIKKVCDAYHQKVVLQTNHHFWKPPVRVIISISPPKKREIDIPRGQNPWFESIAEKNGAQGWSPNLLVLNPNRMLSFATQKMHLFGASCCPGWSSYMVLLNHVRHFGVNCVLFGAFVGLEWNSCIYNR